jgi:hypothetical protein
MGRDLVIRLQRQEAKEIDGRHRRRVPGYHLSTNRYGVDASLTAQGAVGDDGVGQLWRDNYLA